MPPSFQESIPGLVALAIGAGAGALTVWGYWRAAWLRTLLRYAGVAPIAVAAIFLFVAPTSALAWPASVDPDAAAVIPTDPAPIVLVCARRVPDRLDHRPQRGDPIRVLPEPRPSGAGRNLVPQRRLGQRANRGGAPDHRFRCDGAERGQGASRRRLPEHLVHSAGRFVRDKGHRDRHRTLSGVGVRRPEPRIGPCDPTLGKPDDRSINRFRARPPSRNDGVRSATDRSVVGQLRNGKRGFTQVEHPRPFLRVGRRRPA